MAKHVKNMDRKQNFAKYGNSMSFWEFLVQTFQGQTNHQWWWHPKVVPMMIFFFQNDFFFVDWSWNNQGKKLLENRKIIWEQLWKHCKDLICMRNGGSFMQYQECSGGAHRGGGFASVPRMQQGAHGGGSFPFPQYQECGRMLIE